MNEFARTHPVVAVSTGDSPADVERFRQSTGMAYPVYLDDGRTAKAFGIAASPTCLLVQPDGTVSFRGPKPPEGRP